MGMRSTRDIILQTLIEYYEENKRPATVSEIYLMMRRKGYRVSERWIRVVLDRLANEGKVEKIGQRPSLYKPLVKRAPRIVPLTRFLGPMSTSEEISGRIELREAEYTTEKVAYYVLKLLTEQPGILAKIENLAEKISQANPIDVALELLDYLCRTFNKCVVKGGKDNLYFKVLTRVERLVKRYYASVLGIPVNFNINPKLLERHDLSILCGNAGEDILGSVAGIGFSIRSSKEVPNAIMVYNRGKVESYLKERFVDDSIVVNEPLANPQDYSYISGHDTSYWPTTLTSELFPEFSGIPVAARLYILAGIRYYTWRSARGSKVYYSSEIDPHPRRFAELERYEAIHNGYLVTPEMIEESEERASRLVEAAMNILEYTMIQNALQGRYSDAKLAIEGMGEDAETYIEERPLIPPRPIFHDGRIFPYEHKLSDYIGGYGSWHSRLVRLSIRKFYDLVKAVMGDEKTLIVGVVKRAQSPYLHPLIIWLLYKYKGINEEGFWDYVIRWMYERFEITALLRGLLKKGRVPPGHTLRTAGVMRRFWAMDETYMRAYTATKNANPHDEYDEDFWLKKPIFSVEQLRQNVGGLKGYIELHGGVEEGADEILAYVLANATVVMTYIMPSPHDVNLEATGAKLEVVLPRYEVLVRPLSYYEFELDEYKSYIRRTLHKLALPHIPGRMTRPVEGILFRYEVAEISDEILQRKWNIYTVVPHHVKMADEISRRYDEQLRTMYINELLVSIARILRAKSGEAFA